MKPQVVHIKDCFQAVFSLSTFDTDYLLIREHDLARAREALGAHYALRDA